MTQFITAYTRLLNALDEHGIDTGKLRKGFDFYNTYSLAYTYHADKEVEKKLIEEKNKVPATHIYKLIFQVGQSTFDMVESILSQKKESYWLVTTNNNELHQQHDWPVYAKSPEKALMGIKELLVSTRIMLDDIKVTNESIGFFAKGEEIVRMQPLMFETVNESGRAQAEACFKNLQQYQAEVASRRLQKLPGMDQLQTIESSRTADAERGKAFLPSIKTTVKIIKDSLEAEGLELTLSVAQEVTARFLSGLSWQVLIAMSRKTADKCILPPVMLSEGNYLEESRIRYYRTYADGVWAFAQQAEQQNLYPEIIRGYLGVYPLVLCARAEKRLAKRLPTSHDEAFQMLDEVETNNYVLETRELNELLFDDDPDEFLGVVGLDAELTTRHLKELFYTELATDDKIRAFNRNTGEVDFLRIKDWLFSIESKHRDRPLLRVERIGVDGLPVKRAKYLYIYKGEIGKNIKMEWELKGDYGKDVIANLNDFSEEELRSLKDFSGLSSYFLSR